jgi:8-oxo-dGTP diphosphatase
MLKIKKPIYNVVGAAIVMRGEVLALRRSSGIDSVIHKFEFVGGKIDEGETPEEALARECMEELSLSVMVGEKINTVEYEYPEYIVNLTVYFVTPLSPYRLNVHEEERWIKCSDLDPDEWAPADQSALRILKKGYVSTRLATTEQDFYAVGYLAEQILHENYDGKIRPEQINYMLAYFSREEIEKNISMNGFKYNLIFFNGENVGFYAYCPAKYFRADMGDGTYLSKLYLLKFAHGNKISTKVLNSLRRPVCLTVERDNTQAVNVCKHCGFKITESVSTDLGNGYRMEDFFMVLGK